MLLARRCHQYPNCRITMTHVPMLGCRRQWTALLFALATLINGNYRAVEAKRMPPPDRHISSTASSESSPASASDGSLPEPDTETPVLPGAVQGGADGPAVPQPNPSLLAVDPPAGDNPRGHPLFVEHRPPPQAQEGGGSDGSDSLPTPEEMEKEHEAQFNGGNAGGAPVGESKSTFKCSSTESWHFRTPIHPARARRRGWRECRRRRSGR